MEMIISRNLTSHTFNESTAVKIATAIRSTYFAEFITFQRKMNRIKQEEQT
ncbi:MAG: nucleotidyltransferase substrate binding protein [Chloroflexi bacterium]|nr:nucleotidyltransferase substrate binding protein [Chloroflexota bacterium]